MIGRVEVLGRLALIRGGQEITHFESGRVAALLAYLAIFHNRPHPREELIELLWPDADPVLTRPRLRQALYALRSQLEPPGTARGSVLMADRHAVRLNPSAYTCDAVEFQLHCEQGQNQEARALYRGDLLPGFYDDWILLERERLAELFSELMPNASTPYVSRSAAEVEAESSARLLGVPTYITPLHGRADERIRLLESIRANRLTTLSGPGGVGKTRLAATVARDAAPFFEIVAFAALAECVSPIQIPDAVRSALQLPASAADPLDQAAAVLTGRTALLVLDNYEHLVAAGGLAVVEALIERAPELTCLVTSRRLLGLDGEREFLLAPLPAPTESDSLEEAANSPAVALFVGRAQAARAGFHLTESNRQDVIAVCSALDGMPLALELAASRIRSLSPHEMLTQIETRFQWLVRSGAGADKEPRQRSLAAAVEWSWRLLAPAQQRFLAGLCVFRGGWTAEAAAMVCDTDDARERLEALIMDSLVVSSETISGDTRFNMLETIRAFVRERASPSALVHLVDRHREFYLALARRDRDENEALIVEADNLVAALESAIASGNAEAALALCLAVDERWMALVGGASALRLVRAALALTGAPRRARVGVTILASYFALLSEDADSAEALALRAEYEAEASPAERGLALVMHARVVMARYDAVEGVDEWIAEAIDLASRAQCSKTLGLALRFRGALATRRGEYAAANSDLTRSLELLEAESRVEAGYTLDSLANLAVQRGELDLALGLYEKCRRRAERAGNRVHAAKVLQNLACVYGRQHRWDDSVSAGRECVSQNLALGNIYIAAFGLWNVAEALAFTGREAAAAQIMGGVSRHWVDQYGPLDSGDLAYCDTVRARIELAVGPDRTAALWKAGEQLTIPALVALALA